MTSLVVATSPFALTLIACFVADIFAGDPGYPRRIRQPPGGPEQRGREVTIALAGTPIAIAWEHPRALPAAAFCWRLRRKANGVPPPGERQGWTVQLHELPRPGGSTRDCSSASSP